MILLRSFIICMLFLITTQSSQLSAAERLEVEIRSSILNIREIRSTSSPVIEVLNRGDRLTVTTTDMRDWLNLDDGRGFISINYVNVLSRTPVLLAPTEEDKSLANKPLSLPTKAPDIGLAENNTDIPLLACNPNKTDSQLQIKSSTKTCRKNLSTLGYESCQLLFNLTLTRACSSKPLKVTCSANALAINSQLNQNLYELTNTFLIDSSTTETSILLEWFPVAESTTIQKINLSDGQCKIIF